MQVLGLTIARTASLERAKTKAALDLAGVSGSRGWWPLIRDWTTGAWQRNEEISVPTVLPNPTLYACITLIAADIAKLGLRLVERDKDGVWVETYSPAFSPFLRKPNHYQTRIDFIEWWLVSKLVHGNTYALKARDARGVVVAAYILDPTRVAPLVAPDGSVFYQLYEDSLNQTKSVVVPAREMFHDLICPLFHPLCGVPPLYAAAFSALQGLNIRTQSNKFFMNGSKPGGVLTAPGNIAQDTARRLKEYWESEFSGDNIGKIAVLGDGLKYEAMAVTADQAQLVQQLRMTDEDIAKCFHMPRHKVGIGPDPTYNNIEALNIQYDTDCLHYHIEKLELVLEEGLGLPYVSGHEYGVEFNRDDLVQMDTVSMIRSEKEAAGIKTVNESRKRLGLPAVEGGNTVYRQQQDYSIEALNRRDSQETPPSDMNTESGGREDADETAKMLAAAFVAQTKQASGDVEDILRGFNAEIGAAL